MIYELRHDDEKEEEEDEFLNFTTPTSTDKFLSVPPFLEGTKEKEEDSSPWFLLQSLVQLQSATKGK